MCKGSLAIFQAQLQVPFALSITRLVDEIIDLIARGKVRLDVAIALRGRTRIEIAATSKKFSLT